LPDSAYPARNHWVDPAVPGLANTPLLHSLHRSLLPIAQLTKNTGHNTSVNPARSTAVALFAGGEFISQLWVFWLALLAGRVPGCTLGKVLFSSGQEV